MSIRVIAQTDPFDPYSRITKEVSGCRTIKGIFRKLSIKYKEVECAVSINGEIVTDWNTKVYDNDLILVKILPTGDYTATTILGGLQIIGGAILVASGLGAMEGFSLIFSGVSTVVAPFLQSWLSDSGVEDGVTTNVNFAESKYLRGGENSFGHNKSIPILLGTHLVYPYQIANPFTEYNVSNNIKVRVDSDILSVSEYYRKKFRKQLDKLAKTPYKESIAAEIIRLYTFNELCLLDQVTRGQAITTYADVQVCASYSTSSEESGALMKKYFLSMLPVGALEGGVTGTANKFTQKLHQVFLWGHKDVVIDNSTLKMEDTELAKAGDPAYTHDALPYYGNTTKKQVSVYKSLPVFDVNGISDNPLIPNGAKAFEIILPQNINNVALFLTLGKFLALDNDGNFITPISTVVYQILDITQQTPVILSEEKITIKGGSNNLSENQVMTAVKYELATNLDENKSYQINVWRGYDDVTDPSCLLYNSNVKSYTSDIVLSHLLCDINAPLMASEANTNYKYTDFLTTESTIEGEVDNFNALCSLHTYAYSGTGTGKNAWVKQQTNNPASMYLYVLQGPPNKRPVSDDEIDWATLEAWYIFCEAEGYECNTVIQDPGTVESILNLIALSGRASTNNGQKYSVIIDKPRDYPTQLITNVNSYNMQLTRTFNDDVHAIYFAFTNAQVGYKPDEMVVYADGYNKANATKIIDQTMPMVTNPDQIYKLGKFMLNCFNRRVETMSVSMDVEYLLAQPGDLVNVSYDQLLLGLGRGRILQVITDGEGLTTGFVVDTEITMEAGKDYVAVVRLTDGSFALEGASTNISLVNTEETTSVFYLTNPQVTNISNFNLVSLGEAESVVGEYIVTDITPGENLSATLTLINYAEEVYTIGTLPEFVSNVALPASFGSSPILEEVYNVDSLAQDVASLTKKVAEMYDPAIKYAIRSSAPEASLLRNNCLEVALSNNHLYYVDRDSLKIYQTTFLPGADSVLLVDSASKAITVDSDDTYVFYTNLEDTNHLYRINVASGVITQVTNTASILPKIIDDTFVSYVNYDDGNKLYIKNFTEGVGTGEVLLDFPVNSYDIYETYLIWSAQDTRETYIKSYDDSNPSNRGVLYNENMLYNIIATSPSHWTYSVNTTVAVHIAIDSLKSITITDDFYGDVVTHAANSGGRYVMINTNGNVYATTFSGEEINSTLDTEVISDVVGDISCELKYLDNRIYNIGVSDIVNIAKGDSVTGENIQEDTVVTYVGSNYVTMSKYALASNASATIDITGTRLKLNANKVIVPGTISAGLVESDFFNSYTRVPDTAPQNQGEPLYSLDSTTGVLKLYNTNGDLIFSFDPETGLTVKGDGSFTGDITGASGNFTGDITGASGTFSGDLDVSGGDITGATITAGSITGTEITAGSIDGTNISGGVIDGSYIKSGTDSDGMRLSSGALTFRKNNNNAAVLFPTDSTEQFASQGVALQGDLGISGNLGLNGILWTGSYLRAQNGRSVSARVSGTSSQNTAWNTINNTGAVSPYLMCVVGYSEVGTKYNIGLVSYVSATQFRVEYDNESTYITKGSSSQTEIYLYW